MSAFEKADIAIDEHNVKPDVARPEACRLVRPSSPIGP